MEPEILSRLFKLTHMTVMRNLNGITDEEGLTAPEGGGSSINFVLGHIVVTRESILSMLDSSGVCPEAVVELYARGADAPEESMLPLAELVRLYRESQEIILTRLSGLTPEGLEREQGDSTLLQELLEYYFHETYHAGQLGVLRRLTGKPGALS